MKALPRPRSGCSLPLRPALTFPAGVHFPEQHTHPVPAFYITFPGMTFPGALRFGTTPAQYAVLTAVHVSHTVSGKQGAVVLSTDRPTLSISGRVRSVRRRLAFWTERNAMGLVWQRWRGLGTKQGDPGEGAASTGDAWPPANGAGNILCAGSTKDAASMAVAATADQAGQPPVKVWSDRLCHGRPRQQCG